LADFISAEGGFSLETMQENPAHPRIIMTPLARNFLDTIEAFRYVILSRIECHIRSSR
jgi:hypothetical protein